MPFAATAAVSIAAILSLFILSNGLSVRRILPALDDDVSRVTFYQDSRGLQQTYIQFAWPVNLLYWLTAIENLDISARRCRLYRVPEGTIRR